MDTLMTETAVIWRTAGGGAAHLDHCHLHGTRSGWSLEGVILTAIDGQPAKITYRVSCDRFWRTGMVGVNVLTGTELLTRRIGLAPQGEWLDYTGTLDLAHLAACTDIDLGFTPATNTVAIRRLNLDVGQSAEISAAWMRLPGLTLEPLRQTYTRLDAARYRYESASGFSAELAVDEDGLVVDYTGGWERVTQ
jgi:hypothetical protein